MVDISKIESVLVGYHIKIPDRRQRKLALEILRRHEHECDLPVIAKLELGKEVFSVCRDMLASFGIEWEQTVLDRRDAVDALAEGRMTEAGE